MSKYQEAMNYLWKSYDENKIYGIASRGYLEMLQDLANKAESFKWIPVSERLPDEHDSIFAKLHGTDIWSDALWRTQSKEVLVTLEYEDGIRTVKSSHTTDGKWSIEKKTTLSKFKVIAWMELPEHYKGESK